MKKKLLPLALAAAAGFTGIQSAQAQVHVNPEGTGQVLLFPFYTVESSTDGDANDTLISIVNTTNQTKAVKVRFREAMNTEEVLDFNLYLSPQDHWSAAITRHADGGAAVLTGDSSCTSPTRLAFDADDKAAGRTSGDVVAFRTTDFDGTRPGDTADSVKGLDRTREGYIEVIEMGVITDAGLQADIKHAAGFPDDCATVDAASVQGGALETNAGGALIGTPTGGLYGYGTIINSVKGTAAGYDAVALDTVYTSEQFANPGDDLPSLLNANTDATLFVNGALTEMDMTTATGTAVGALADIAGWASVSAVLMASSISNDYVLDSGLNAGTDWVVTFPTKRPFVNRSAVTAPFKSQWSATTSTACEEIGIQYYDREEKASGVTTGNDFSPTPPAGPALSLCYEANVVTFEGSKVLNGSSRVSRDLTLGDGFENGWLKMSFTTQSDGTTAISGRNLLGDDINNSGTDVTLSGLPVIGFAVQRYVNGAAEGGALANYAIAVDHKRN